MTMLAAILGVVTLVTQAQHNHADGHAQYQDWQSNAGFNCCNNRDCGELPDKDVRENGPSIEIRVESTWCPVTFNHLLKAGKSPDWSKNHACIVDQQSGQSACDRFKCFVGAVRF